jgi:hypothetical protein
MTLQKEVKRRGISHFAEMTASGEEDSSRKKRAVGQRSPRESARRVSGLRYAQNDSIGGDAAPLVAAGFGAPDQESSGKRSLAVVVHSGQN